MGNGLLHIYFLKIYMYYKIFIPVCGGWITLASCSTVTLFFWQKHRAEAEQVSRSIRDSKCPPASLHGLSRTPSYTVQKLGSKHLGDYSFKPASLHGLSRTPSYTVQKLDSKHFGDCSFKEVINKIIGFYSTICITDLEFPLSGKCKADLPCRSIESGQFRCRCFQDLRDTSAPHKSPLQLEFPACMTNLHSQEGNKQSLFRLILRKETNRQSLFRLILRKETNRTYLEQSKT